MKSKVFIALCVGIVMAGCQKDNEQTTPGVNKNGTAESTAISSSSSPGSNAELRTSTQYGSLSSSTNTTGSEFISVIDANLMIGSYLYSIHSERNDSDIRSYSVDADMLRAYLADSSVKNVKLIFAHTLDYMRAGHAGQYAGYKTGAMTIIIAAYNERGNYVFHNGMVLDHLCPCPYNCPSGIAASDLLY